MLLQIRMAGLHNAFRVKLCHDFILVFVDLRFALTPAVRRDAQFSATTLLCSPCGR